MNPLWALLTTFMACGDGQCRSAHLPPGVPRAAEQKGGQFR